MADRRTKRVKLDAMQNSKTTESFPDETCISSAILFFMRVAESLSDEYHSEGWSSA